jgi:hypothetical protein
VTVVVAVVLAALGACCYAAGTRLQHQALRSRFTDAVRHPRWLGGLAALGAGVAMALPHLVRPGHNGFLFPPGDVEALAGYLGTLLEDRELRLRMGRAGREIVAGHDLGRTLTTFEDLYLRAAGGDPQRKAATAPATAAATATTPTGHPAPRVSLPHPRPATESEHRHDEYAARPGRR